MSNTIDLALARLEYDRRWLDFRFISPEIMLNQAAQHEAAGDSVEHFRFAAFNAALENYSDWTNEQTEQFAELIEIDPDIAMAESVLRRVLILDWTDHQFGSFTKCAARRYPQTDALVPQYRIFRELASEDLCRAAAEKALGCTMSFIQIAALEVVAHERMLDLARSFAVSGVSRHVRHQAREIARKLSQS